MTEVPFGEEWAGQWEAAGAERAERAERSDRPEDLADRPWTPIPRQAHTTERGLIPAQRRLKKTSRSA